MQISELKKFLGHFFFTNLHAKKLQTGLKKIFPLRIECLKNVH